MTQTVVFKRSFAVAMIMLMRYTMPAVVGVPALWASTRLHGVPFHPNFVFLAVLVAVLAPIVLQPPPLSTMQLVVSPWPQAAGLVLRWLVLLGILLGIGYVTKLSEEFSRRVILTWAVAAPLLLVLVALVLSAAMRRIMFAPSSARRAVFAGYNEVSLALANR